ncbi:uncharacterized protein N7483_008618 [Penicillium malachiteum]|uniref:uncharacterized protein n=1 Tax=Penicillium malachiteum TaxID=1324776 RepID=UPI00254683A0|nr:uncharacterized protein N7483_008618 [Penicillium malachiteum]KAJ5720684.1 hypothetical protein N7483_008618 [Penicillium malachiteum]
MTSILRPSEKIVRDLVEGHVAIVTGAAQGIGFATASLLAKHGARVVLVDLREIDLQRACEQIGLRTTYHVCDVSNWDQQLALFKTVTSTYGPISLLVCNAGVNPEVTRFRKMSPEKRAEMNNQVYYNFLADELEDTKDSDSEPSLKRPSTQIFDVNLNSVIFGLKLGIHYMKPNGGGRIVVIGSAVSYVSRPFNTMYTASKHAVLGLVRSTAQKEDVVQAGISISWIAPWITLTPMVEEITLTTQSDALKSSPEDTAWGILAAAAAGNPNGKGYWVQGTDISEVEGAYSEVARRLKL